MRVVGDGHGRLGRLGGVCACVRVCVCAVPSLLFEAPREKAARAQCARVEKTMSRNAMTKGLRPRSPRPQKCKYREPLDSRIIGSAEALCRARSERPVIRDRRGGFPGPRAPRSARESGLRKCERARVSRKIVPARGSASETVWPFTRVRRGKSGRALAAARCGRATDQRGCGRGPGSRGCLVAWLFRFSPTHLYCNSACVLLHSSRAPPTHTSFHPCLSFLPSLSSSATTLPDYCALARLLQYIFFYYGCIVDPLYSIVLLSGHARSLRR
jgi:hypothetical protein